MPAGSQQSASASNGKPSVIPVSTQSPMVTQPVRDDVTMDPSCDSYGVCYDVTLKCTDTKILVNVKTSKPFHGRIYALGRSETCNAHIRNSQQFQLDMSLSGQDCNTQSVVRLRANQSRTSITIEHLNLITGRHLHEHGRAAASQRGTDQGGQGVSRAMHIRDDLAQCFVRHDAGQVITRLITRSADITQRCNGRERSLLCRLSYYEQRTTPAAQVVRESGQGRPSAAGKLDEDRTRACSCALLLSRH